jgi:hypothetical protein
MKRKIKISRDAIMFFNVELRNDGGTQPATLGSAYDTFNQKPINVGLDWCGYKPSYLNATSWGVKGSLAVRFNDELGIELRRLIRHYGKKHALVELV